MLAGANGLFHPECDLGDAVAAGAKVAAITNPRNVILQWLTAPTDGTVLAMRSKAGLRRGDWGVLVGTPLEESL